MQMQQVQYFLALCQECNFTRAARRCAVTQPTLTVAIRQLEAELGGSLFKREGRISTLSGLGVAVQPHLGAIDAAADEAKRAAAAFLAASPAVPPLRLEPVPRFKPEENAMRKAVLSAAIAVTVLLVAGIAIHTLQPATASSSSKAGDIVGIYKLELTIDLKALPRQELNYVD